MTAHPAHVNDLNDLQDFVHTTLCLQNELEYGVFPFAAKLLKRAGRPCGMYFCLYGPRSVKFTAIWETEKNTVLFYGSSGERICKTQLPRPPQLVTLEAL
jgi:hypothetical protein